jgi:CBS domain containing-hemolysin-like protein
MAEPAIADLLRGPLESIGVSGTTSTGVALVIALLLATSFTMIFGELVPKNLALARPLATARAVQGFQRGFSHSMRLPIRFLNGTANAILRRLGIEPQEELASARSPEELASLVERSAEQGTLAVETATLVQRSLAFGERQASDVMTPRMKMQTVDADEPVVEVLKRARATGHSRFPVWAHVEDQVTGVVHIKQAMSVPYERRGQVPVRDVMVAPVLVPSTVELDPLLEQLRRGGFQMAVVVDEWGNVDGIVTLEDLIEEIVGEVRDEHDPGDERVRRERDGGWTLSGLLRPDEVAAEIGIGLPEDEDYETLGGLIGMLLERMPHVGDTVGVDAVDDERTPQIVTLTVLRMDGLRVDRVRLEHRPVDPQPDADGRVDA